MSTSHRLLINFQNSSGWTCHFLEADRRTPVGGFIKFASFGDLRAFFLCWHPEDISDFDHCIRAWGGGSTWVSLTPEQYAKLKKRKITHVH